jgi:hypothetical protein
MDWTAEVRSPTEAEDSSSNLCLQTGSGTHPASLQCVPGALSPGIKRGRGVMLTTHPLLVLRLRKSRSYSFSHPNAPLRSVTGPLCFFLPLLIRTERNYVINDTSQTFRHIPFFKILVVSRSKSSRNDNFLIEKLLNYNTVRSSVL